MDRSQEELSNKLLHIINFTNYSSYHDLFFVSSIYVLNIQVFNTY